MGKIIPDIHLDDCGYEYESMYAGMTDDEKKAAKNRVQAEKDDNDAILKLRNKIYNILKNKYKEFDKVYNDQKLYLIANDMMINKECSQILDLYNEYGDDDNIISINEIINVLDIIKNIKNENRTNNSTSNVYFVDVCGLNVRSGAGFEYNIIDGVYRGTEVDILEIKDEWCYIRYCSNVKDKPQEGWVYRKYINSELTNDSYYNCSNNHELAYKIHVDCLTENQNKLFDELVSDWIPKLEAMFKGGDYNESRS